MVLAAASSQPFASLTAATLGKKTAAAVFAKCLGAAWAEEGPRRRAAAAAAPVLSAAGETSGRNSGEVSECRAVARCRAKSKAIGDACAQGKIWEAIT
jgi:hypothetical protein